LTDVGQAGNEGSSPYCTEEELVEFWDGRTVPAFDRLQDVEELHAKRRSKCAVHSSIKG
jgi:hypothetical protein